MRRAFVLLAALTVVAQLAAAESEKLDTKKTPMSPPPPFPDETLVPVLNAERAASSAEKSKPNAKPSLPAPALTPPAPLTEPRPTHFDILHVKPAKEGLPGAELVSIGFFNHSDRDVTLQINEHTLKLSSHHYTQMKLPREFKCAEGAASPATVKVPVEADGVEIVFRK